MIRLVKVVPVSRRLAGSTASVRSIASSIVRAHQRDGSGASMVAALIRPPPRRAFSAGNRKPEDEEKALPSEEPNEEEAIEDDDAVSSLANTIENAVVRATVPDFVPEVIGLPVDRRPVFPGFYKTIAVRDEKVGGALIKALKKGQPYVGLFLAKADEPEEISGDAANADSIKDLGEIHAVGTFAQIINVIPAKGDGVTAIVYPHRRIRATELLPPRKDGASRVRIENVPPVPFKRSDQTVRAMMQELFVMLSDVAKLNPFFREHITHHNVPANIFDDPARLADFVALLTSSEPGELQEIMEAERVEDRLRLALVLLKKELMTAELQNTIRRDVESKLNKKQREYFLHEQLKSIKKELGLETDTKEKLTEQFRERAERLQFPEEARKVFDEELNKLAVLEPAGAEFNVTRNYLDWLTQLPWGRTSPESLDPAEAKTVLDEDHYGLQDVKDRILEFIAVGRLRGSVAGKILCFVGPPGVGKTSIGKSIARALHRQYYRFSVGGLSDVAEIKGHRRTYVGAMPGKAIQALKKVQTENPLVLIDEIDKLGRGHQGDPASALLELLDPEQNAAFLDHYMDVPVDLSKVLFVCTANTVDTIPGPLLDRMEVITLSGYVAQEKMAIAKQYLIPAAREAAGVTEAQAKLTDAAIEALNRGYCRESGVRNLKKHLEKLFRKAALKIVNKDGATTTTTTTQMPPLVIDEGNLKEYVGSPLFISERLYEGPKLPAGVVTGLAWTSMGGSILYMETILERITSAKDAKPGLIRTGQLGKVMEESSTIAYSYAKAFMTKHYPHSDFFQHAAIHLHVPEGATPKDGPSAGTTMTTALLSLALNKPVPADLAMTGELSLTGKVMKIGGVREKVIAAKRAAIRTVLLPKANKADWDELQEYIREGIQVHFVESFEDVARICGLLPMPEGKAQVS